jgi:hypothetical protein
MGPYRSVIGADGISPSRYAVVKADNEGAAAVLVKENMGEAQRADLIRQVVRDETAFQDGYRDQGIR